MKMKKKMGWGGVGGVGGWGLSGSSIESGGSGPLFDGDTEPAPESPQQCLVLQPFPPLCGLGILDHFSMAGEPQAKNVKRR